MVKSKDALSYVTKTQLASLANLEVLDALRTPANKSFPKVSQIDVLEKKSRKVTVL